MDLSKIITGAVKAAERTPGYKLYPAHAVTVEYRVQIYNNALRMWEDGLANVEVATEMRTFTWAVQMCEKYVESGLSLPVRVVGIVEVTR